MSGERRDPTFEYTVRRRLIALTAAGALAAGCVSGVESVPEPVYESGVLVTPYGCDPLPKYESHRDNELSSWTPFHKSIVPDGPGSGALIEGDGPDVPAKLERENGLRVDLATLKEQAKSFKTVTKDIDEQTGLITWVKSDGPIKINPGRSASNLHLILDLRHTSEDPRIVALAECYYRRLVIEREFAGVVNMLLVPSDHRMYFRNGVLTVKEHPDDTKHYEPFVASGATPPVPRPGVRKGMFGKIRTGTYMAVAPGTLASSLEDANMHLARTKLHEDAHLITRLMPGLPNAIGSFDLVRDEKIADLITSEVLRHFSQELEPFIEYTELRTPVEFRK